MRAAALALVLVWSACPHPAAGCDFPLFTDAVGRAIPDAFVRVTATPRSGGPEVERGLFLAKVSSFGPCPPKKADALPLLIRLANPSGAILLLPPTMLWLKRVHAGEMGTQIKGGLVSLLLAGGLQDACNGLDAAPGIIIVADRGTCNFLNKTLNAYAANASGLLVGNTVTVGEEEELPLMGCPDGLDSACNNVTIPTIIIYSQDRQLLQGWLQSSDFVLMASLFRREHPKLDPSSLLICLLGTCTVVLGAQLSVAKDRARVSGRGTSGVGSEDDEDDALPIQDLTLVHAFGFVVMASAMLVLLFFFIRSIIIFLVIMYCFASVSAITNVFGPLLQHFLPSLRRKVRVPVFEHVAVSHLVCFCAAATMASVWFCLRKTMYAWPIQDFMSISLCLQILNTVRFTDIQVCSVLLSLALVYDIFWVFISPLLFSENVMIATATGTGHTWNNNTDVPPAEMIPMLLVVPKIIDWAGGVTLLGLGDVVLPGLLVAFSLRVDVIKGYSSRRGYFGYMVFGYAVGLSMAILASVLMHMGQPALLYLVPCTLWPFLMLAWARGEVRELWEGLQIQRPASMDPLCAGSGESSGGEDVNGTGEDGDGVEQMEEGVRDPSHDVARDRTRETSPEGRAEGGAPELTEVGRRYTGANECRQRLLAPDELSG